MYDSTRLGWDHEQARYRRLVVGVLILAVISFAGLAFVIWSSLPTVRIQAAAADPGLIHTGTSLNDVESLLGVPPGDYSTTLEHAPRLPPDPVGDVPKWDTTAEWYADHAALRVYFDHNGQVLFSLTVREPAPTPWQRIRRRMGW